MKHGMTDGIAMIDHVQRSKILEAARMAKMARSAHAYVRGNTASFYEWLAEAKRADIPEGPPVWICGDCHLGNLGPLADADGRVEVQIRDLDQTVIGNPAHDLVRLGLSLASAARGSDLPGVTTAHMLEEMVRGYVLALGDPRPDDKVPEPDVVRTIRKRALGRRWRHLAKERIKDAKPVIPIGNKFWALSDDERTAIDGLFRLTDVRRLVLALKSRSSDDDLKVVDAAYWMKGCSSLGKLRYAVLLQLQGGDRKEDFAMVDIKEAVAAVAPAAPDADMPAHHGLRVVSGARALSPNLGDRMIASDLLDRAAVLRELMPQDLKLEVDQFSRREAVDAARYLAYVVGRAHARQMDEPTRLAWRKELDRHHPRGMDAPNWLWSSVVELAARHEAAYLEHCRHYVLAGAA